MISHKYKCIFIHIPKCAGTSIESALGHLDNHTARGGQDHRTIRAIQHPLILSEIFSSINNITEALKRIRYYFRAVKNPRNKITVTKEQYEEYFKFTFIRNPWSRVYSCYQNIMSDDIHKRNLNIRGQLSLQDFLRLYSGQKKSIAQPYWMLRPQTHWLKDFRGSIPLDYIGRFEHLPEDFKQVCKALQISPITLPHKIKGSSQDYREHYDEASKRMVMQVYREEIEMFGYSFD